MGLWDLGGIGKTLTKCACKDLLHCNALFKNSYQMCHNLLYPFQYFLKSQTFIWVGFVVHRDWERGEEREDRVVGREFRCRRTFSSVPPSAGGARPIERSKKGESRVLRLWRPPSSNISTDLMNNSTDPNPSTTISNNCSRLTAVINAASVDCCAEEFEFGEPFIIQDGKVLYIMTNAVKWYFLSLLLTIFSWWCLKTSLSPKTWSLVRLKRLPSQLTGENSFFCHPILSLILFSILFLLGITTNSLSLYKLLR